MNDPKVRQTATVVSGLTDGELARLVRLIDRDTAQGLYEELNMRPDVKS